MLAPNPLAVTTWPIAGDVPDLLAIVTEQADTVASQEALIHAYQGNLNLAQGQPGGPAATGTGTASGTTLTMTGVSGTIAIGAVVTSTLVIPSGTTVLGQISGATGGAGVYLTSAPTTMASATPVLFSAVAGNATASAVSSGTQLTVTGVTGVIVTGAVVTSTALIPAGTTILSQTAGAAGGSGTYTTSVTTTASNTPLFFVQAPSVSVWPVPQDQATLDLLVQQQTAIIRTQTALIQHYQDVLNTSQTPAPPSGP